MITSVAFSPRDMPLTSPAPMMPSSQPVEACCQLGTVARSCEMPLMTWLVPIFTLKSPRPTDESNLDGGVRKELN